jgi:ParB family chromosome partitioning protein
MTKTQEKPTDAASSVDTFALIPLALLDPDPNNVRDELTGIEDLAASIFQLNLQQPLRVRAVETVEGEVRYMVLAGHRRLAAITMNAGAEPPLWVGDVPCMIAPDNITDDDVTASMLVENLQRADLNPVEEARAFERLTKQYRYKRADLALKIGRSESYVADRLSLLKLPDSVLASVSVGHYPLTAALMLVKLPHAVIERITKGGRTIVNDQYAISRALAEHEYQTLKDTLAAAGVKSGIEIFTGPRYEFQNTSDLIAEFKTLEDAKLLAKYEGAPKGARLVSVDSPYSHSYSIELRKPLTEKQIEAAKAKAAAERSAAEQQREQERADRFAAERASWTPEKQAWSDECDRLKAEHVAEVAAYEKAVDDATVAWAKQANAKAVARWSMLQVFETTDNWTMHDIAKQLGLGPDNTLHARDLVVDYVTQSASNLIQVVALCLTNDDEEMRVPEAVEDRDGFIARAKIVEPAELVLPEEPAVTKEELSDDPINDVA